MSKKMKTSVEMVRELGNMKVLQRSCDGFFDASGLLREWNTYTKSRKQATRYLEKASTLELLEELKVSEGSDTPLYTVNKGRRIKASKTNDKVWMCPLLFIDFAMWLNPKFRVTVLKFVMDKLIEFRNEIGVQNKELVTLLPNNGDPYRFAQVSKALNNAIFGRHQKDIRNTASQEQVTQMSDLMKKLMYALSEGYISTIPEVLASIARYKV